MNPNPTCQTSDKCMFAEDGMTMTTCMYYPPVYKNGVNVNPDRNTTSGGLRCVSCDKRWAYSMQLNDITYVEINN